MRKIATLTLLAAFTLSACGRTEDDAPATNNMVEPPVENVIIEEPEAPLPETQNNAVATPAAPPPSVSEQQQILDDAEATGMTARLPEGGESSQPADETSTKGE